MEYTPRVNVSKAKMKNSLSLAFRYTRSIMPNAQLFYVYCFAFYVLVFSAVLFLHSLTVHMPFVHGTICVFLYERQYVSRMFKRFEWSMQMHAAGLALVHTYSVLFFTSILSLSRSLSIYSLCSKFFGFA